MNPCCVLTGHFVPPPGLDPWMGLRHDYSPTENYQQQWVKWNRSCYGANSASRVLTPEGKIRDIVNNYRFLNFSIAPSLADELARSSPNVFRRLKEADAESLDRWGHGNAIARPWQEVILPMLSPDRAALQVDWGLSAFEHYFGHAAEGFCFPHNAVNADVLDLLVDRGIRYILLSGTQAEGIMPLGKGSWTSLGGAPAPSDRPFQIDRPRGSLAVFFPDESLSRGLVSDGLLRDASRLEQVIRTALQPTGFINAAARAETFGIDEPFSDMCLAALWEKLRGASPVDCTNYGWVLENRPPRELVKLRRGDDDLGSSNECPHGVGRWHSDCGCRNSAQSQGWKAPLSAALDEWESMFVQQAEAEAGAVGVEPRELRMAVPSLVLGPETPREWAQNLLGRHESSAEDHLISAGRKLEWSQSFHQAAIMHCDDPTETLAGQALLAVLKAFDFAPTNLFDSFLTRLESIGLNAGGSMKSYITSVLLRRKHGPTFAAALLLLDRILRPRARYEDQLGPYNVTSFSRSRHEMDEGVFRYTGLIEIVNQEIDQKTVIEYLLLEDHREGVSLYLKDSESAEKPEVFDLQTLPMGDRTEIVQLMGSDLETNLASETQAIFPLLRKSLVYARLLDVQPQPVTRVLMEMAVTRKILGLTEATEVPSEEVFASLEEELGFTKDFGLQLDLERLNSRFSRWLAQALGTPEQFTTEVVVRSVETLLAALGRWSFHPDLTVAQALVFEALRDRVPHLLEALESGKVEALQDLKRLIRLGTLLWIDTSEIKNRVLDL